MGRQQRSMVASRIPTTKISRRRRCGVWRSCNGSTAMLMDCEGGAVPASLSRCASSFAEELPTFSPCSDMLGEKGD
jgi:hypothetical protein